MPRAPNQKYRPPQCVVTRSMADAGKAKLESLLYDVEEHTDDQMVVEVFQAMWETYWLQVEEAKRRKQPHSALLMPTQGLVRQ